MAGSNSHGAPQFDKMGIYIEGRVGNEIRELESNKGAPLSAEELYAAGCMHYLGDEPLRRAAETMGLSLKGDDNSEGGALPQILDLGSGFGSDSRVLCERYCCRSTAVEVQEHIHAAARDLTERTPPSADFVTHCESPPKTCFAARPP
jgi:hypothetical protein